MEIVATAEEATTDIRPGHRVFVHGGVATPTALLDGLEKHRERLHDVELIHLHTEGEARWAEWSETFRVASLFVGPNMRKHVGSATNDYIPVFLSEMPRLLRSGRRKVDAALIHVSPPDAHGFCTLGTSVDVARGGVDGADLIIAQINPNMPRTHGDGFIHVDEIDYAIEVEDEIPEHLPPDLDEDELKIGRFCSELIEDGSTLQVGIGGIPDAVLRALVHHRHLGVHTEMWSDGVLELIKSGVIDNSRKVVHPGKTVSGFVMGTRKLYDFIDDNPSCVMLDVGYVNNPRKIAKNPKVCAINSAVEVDVTGQVCADSIGTRVISGVGGQMDFMRGASLTEGGRPIIALKSRSSKGHPRIVPTLKEGAGVVTTRAHVHWVVTEHGVADLYGRTLHERADALISIAHPDDREDLLRAWRARAG
jgi:acyl-CoA hydrolase